MNVRRALLVLALGLSGQVFAEMVELKGFEKGAMERAMSQLGASTQIVPNPRSLIAVLAARGVSREVQRQVATAFRGIPRVCRGANYQLTRTLVVSEITELERFLEVADPLMARHWSMSVCTDHLAAMMRQRSTQVLWALDQDVPVPAAEQPFPEPPDPSRFRLDKFADAIRTGMVEGDETEMVASFTETSPHNGSKYVHFFLVLRPGVVLHVRNQYEFRSDGAPRSNPPANP